MRPLESIMRERLRGRTRIIGLGSPDWGDDCLGLLLAAELQAAGVPDVWLGGHSPEMAALDTSLGRPDQVLLLDAVECGTSPGTVVFLGAEEIQNRFSQVSTHKISLGLLARLIEAEIGAAVWLLGIQPASLRRGAELSAPVRQSLTVVRELLMAVLPPPTPTGTAPATPARKAEVPC